MMIEPLLGGLFIGLASSALWIGFGRLFGVSSVLGGLLARSVDGIAWRAALLSGLLAGGFVLRAISPAIFESHHPRSNAALIGAGLLIGYGTRLMRGCTSGHGVCGLARFSLRSLVATVIFIATGMLTASVIGGLS